MTETIKLYDRDAYAIEFEADIISCEPNKADDKQFDIILNQTLFFPEEGGQSPDMGILGGYRVVDVQIKNGVITHTVDISADDCCEAEKEAGKQITGNEFEPEKVELAAGVHVHGKIDWQHRFYNMQQHSGEHIFSGIVHRRFGFENVGFHLSDSVVTMDFSGVVSPEDIAEVEHEVNVAISKNIPIEVTYPSRDELAQLEYRSKIEIEGQVRIVTVPGYDVCACCAPHVKRTGEIGMLKVMNYQNYKGGVRISILCGFRALEAFRQKCDIISELMGIFTTNQEAIVDNVTKLKAVNQSLKSELGTAKSALLDYKVAELLLIRTMQYCLRTALIRIQQEIASMALWKNIVALVHSLQEMMRRAIALLSEARMQTVIQLPQHLGISWVPEAAVSRLWCRALSRQQRARLRKC